jgi:DNA polymerase elongation subunit (family B)
MSSNQMEPQKYDPLIYGKNQIERIVNIEPEDDTCTLFIQSDSGDVETLIVPNRYWILSKTPLTAKAVRMKGDLPFKYGYQFKTKEDFLNARRQWKEKGSYSVYDSKEALMIKDGYTYFKGMKTEDPSILSFDIETVGLNRDDNSKILLISNTFRKNGVVKRRLFAYDDYEGQGDLLEAWCDWVQEINPTLIIGHNIYSYDLPYMLHIADRENITLRLGRFNKDLEMLPFVSKFRVDGSRDQEYRRFRAYGRDLIDTMFLAIKYDIGKKYESYGLKSIVKQEGMEDKDRQFYDASLIRHNYKVPQEWSKIKKYAENDADDSLKLYDLMAPSFFYLTQSVPKSFQQVIETASGSQVNSMMLRSYLQEQHSIPEAYEAKKYEGAISLGNPGIYANVHKVDIVSMYPSIILQNNIYEPLKDPNKNFLTIVEKFTKNRIEHKKLAKTSKYYDDLQNSEKVIINSAYGFLGTAGLNFNSPKNAELVTKIGRDILNTAMDWATKKGFQIVNADTDSISYSDNGKEISVEQRKELIKELNALYPEKIRFEDDGYFKKLIVLKAKNYIKLESVNGKDKVSLKGSSLKSSTLEPKLKELLNELMNAILYDKNDYTDIYLKYVKEALDIKDIKPWCGKKTLSATTYESERSNETKIIEAIKGTEYTEGDKIYTFFKDDGSLCLVERFNGDYSVGKVLEKLYNATDRFETVLPVKELFKNYSLKKYRNELSSLKPTNS